MARPIDPADVAVQLDRFGPLATVMSVTAGGEPHVGTVSVAMAGERLTAKVGPRTCDNLRANPSLSLAWLDPASDYQLIVDGQAHVADGPDPDGLFAVAVTVTAGILHRRADRPDAGPSCLSLRAEADTATGD